MGYSIQDIQSAYRKLKSYVYYDNFSLLLRQKIAEFESNSDFENKLNLLCDFLNDKSKDKSYFENLLKEIDYYVAPKSFSRDYFNFGDNIITNNFTNKEYHLNKVNYFFDGPIELHLISILWILNEGFVLHKDYCKDNYAYFLELNAENGNVVDGLRLFKPYFEQYQKWRDKGVDLAKNIVAEDTDVVVLSLDIKEYYYNINFDESLIDKLKKRIIKDLNVKSAKLTDLIFQVNQTYQRKCPKKGNKSMPIGLLSSGILANWYLKDFDNKVKEELSPAYYGRYVDDILLVLSNTKITKEHRSKEPALNNFLDKFFVKRNILKVENELSIEESDPCKRKKQEYSFIDKPDIKIQKDKIILYSFESKESKAVLDMFKKKIEQNSSAFWFLPNESDIMDDFDESVYELTYTDTINKLRSVTDIKQSKYGASVFLAKRIKVSLLSENKKDDKTTEQILTFFKGIVSLEFSNLWEKVLTYFVIENDKEAFWKFFKETLLSIDSIVGNGKIDKETNYDVKCFLGKYLMNCCGLALALNPNFVDLKWWEARCRNYKYDWFDLNFHNQVIELQNAYIKSNLLRNSFVVVPLLNYLKIKGDKFINLVKYDYLRGFSEIDEEGLELCEKKLKYAPRFIYLYEFNCMNYLLDLLSHSKKENKDLFEDLKQGIYDKSFESFFKTNYIERNVFYKESDPKVINSNREKLKKQYFIIEEDYRNQDSSLAYNKLIIPKSRKIQGELKIAVANTKVNFSNIEKSLFEIPNTNKNRRREFIDLLNEAEKVKSDVLILPEVSTPYRWLPIIADQARRKQRTIIVGLEHIRIHNVCYNLLATILPMEHNGIKDVIINLRLKNHYSPHESKVILDRGKIVPELKTSLYNLFVWGGVHFSSYNCYELADIDHRALFKSKVDVLFASEYNPDINYFSNIVETVSRDVHCYFVQANSSDFGDSRITAPKKTEAKDILRLKGGENSVVLLGKIDIMKLRKFQKTRVRGQNTSVFKNTPPSFDHSNVENR